MSDTTIRKVDSSYSPKGKMGQKYLAAGPGREKPETRRDYETVGFVARGRAELHLGGQMVELQPGDSWVVPEGARHTYRIVEPFEAIEATSPPAHIHSRDGS